jgi:predicted MFS family arabinose efflux permease
VLVARLVERRTLGNAIVLSSLALDSARLVGPSLGGALVAGVGEWAAFLANALSYLAVIGALLAMRLAPQARTQSAQSVRETLAGGIAYAWGTRPIRLALALVALIGFAGSPYAVLMPIMAAEVLGGGPHTLGLLMAASGVGALGGAFYLGQRRDAAGYDRLCGVGAGLFGASVLCFALSRSLYLSLALLMLAGFGLMMLMACTHTLLLMLADEDKRGRVMSLFTLSFMASVPFGNLFAGSIASAVGAPLMIALGSGACLVGALVYWRSLGAPVRDRRAVPRP